MEALSAAPPTTRPCGRSMVYLPISADPHRLLDVARRGPRSRDRLTQEKS